MAAAFGHRTYSTSVDTLPDQHGDGENYKDKWTLDRCNALMVDCSVRVSFGPSSIYLFDGTTDTVQVLQVSDFPFVCLSCTSDHAEVDSSFSLLLKSKGGESRFWIRYKFTLSITG